MAKSKKNVLKSALRKIGRILRGVLMTVLVLIVVFEAVVLGADMIGGEAAVAKLPIYILEIGSDSMYPKLVTGDCVLHADVPFSWLGEEDIITYANNGDLVTHQIVRVNDNDTVTTKGLMNTYEDGQISKEEYMGKVLCRVPFLGVFLSMTDQWAGKLLFIGVVLVVCFGYPLGMAVANKFTKENNQN